jgi:ATP-dependent DNA helicase RecQ
VMHDSSLDDLCRVRPRSLHQLLGVSGFGEWKVKTYGLQILAALRQFQEGSRATVAQEPKVKPTEETLRLLQEGRTFEEIAKLRGRKLSSVVELVCKMMERGKLEFQPGWVEPRKFKQIEAACARHGMQALKTLKEALPPDIFFEEIRLVVEAIRKSKQER